ncbi:MFS transporter [Sphingomonas bacterium]|uniref:MFS transporter n=1 Tax=Sphingomonas bacterium TaxID=1895847 RepID=UPI001574F19A|nr:MFS transporter [Sphingomonas bacterium]
MGRFGTTQAGREWRGHWPLPLVAALGTAASVIPYYSIGPFMTPLTNAFGWSRAQISAGILISNGTAAIFAVLIGLLVDRLGPRRVGLVGVALICTAFGLLGLATGGIGNWYGHWLLVGIGGVTVQTSIWASAVSSRFIASRGLAIAITMCGNGIAAALMPVVAALLIYRYGWRAGFGGVGGVWLVAFLPLLLLFFRGAQDHQGRRKANIVEGAQPIRTGLTLSQGLRSPAFYKLAFAGAIYSVALIGTIVHFVPILIDRGRDPVSAAAIAGFVGIASIVGRLSTGMLLDRFRGDRVAPLAFILPTLGFFLLVAGGRSFPVEAAAALIIGLSVGAELDVIAYLASRYMGLRSYGALFGTMISALSLGTALGPIAAGATFDMSGSYGNFLLAGIPAMLVCAGVLATLGPYPDFDEGIPIATN